MSPSAKQVVVLGQLMATGAPAGGRVLQLAPASVVFRICCPPATTKHVLVLGQLTDRRLMPVPDVWAVQVLPPSVVARIVPMSPTATHSLALGQLMPFNVCVVPKVWGIQVTPADDVARIVPASPTATQALAFAQLTALSLFDGGGATRGV
jgi:hypothetical protein